MPKTKPLIGITAASFPEPDGFDPILGVDRPYLESIQAVGGVPVVIPYLNSEDELKKIVTMCDGFLFPGGKDLSPMHYRDSPHHKLGENDNLQDLTEIALVKLCISLGKPLIGICRGLQMINVALGGTLFQDLPSQCPSHIIHSHANTPQEFRTLIHNIKIENNSMLFDVIKSSEIGINSNHHQAIKSLGEGLITTAFSDDGLIEAIELPSHPFMIAVQGHPEVIWQESEPRWRGLFESFVRAAS